MADVRILYTEEAIGAGHPTKSDVLNRPILVAHDASGHHSSVDFPALSMDVNGTARVLSSAAGVIPLSTSGGEIFNRGYTIASTYFKMPQTGKYLYSATLTFHGSTGINEVSVLGLYRNSSWILEGEIHNQFSSILHCMEINGIVACNSTTDVFKPAVWIYPTVASAASEAIFTFISVCRVAP